MFRSAINRMKLNASRRNTIDDVTYLLEQWRDHNNPKYLHKAISMLQDSL